MKKIKDRVRRALVKYLTRKQLRAITEEDVLTITRKEWMIGRRKLTSDEVLEMKEEAESFLHSNLWRYMKSELLWQSNKQMLDNARSIEDIDFGKAMLYDFSIISKFITNIRDL